MGGVYAGDDGVVEQVECFAIHLHGDFVVDGNVARNAEVDIVEARPDDAVAADLRRTSVCGPARRGTHGAAINVAEVSVAGRAGVPAVHGSAHAEEDGLPAGGDHAS